MWISKGNRKFLGHEGDGEGINSSDDKITAVTNFPKPLSADDVRSFLGLAGCYRPCIRNFVAKTAPLPRLLRKESTFHCGATQEHCFQELKYGLTHTPILALSDYNDPFILCTGASTFRLGAVLMLCDERSKNHVTAYVSRTFNSAEANYSIRHLETLAVVWGLKHFHDIILGYKITIYTNHSAITELFKGRNLTGKLAQ